MQGFGDFHFYHASANLIAAGHWFADPFARGHDATTAIHPPLWTLALSVVSWLGGTSYLAHRILGCVLGAVTIFLAGLLGRRVGGSRVGIAAAFLAAVYPVLIGADGSLMSESLYGMLVAAALLLAFRLRDRPSMRTAAALGAVIALAALTRSEGLLLLVLLALPAALVAAPPGRARRALACVAAAAVVIAPWFGYTWSAFGRPVLITTGDGETLAGSNCPRVYRGADIGLMSTACLTRTVANEADQAARFRAQGLDYMSDHAGRVPLVVAARELRTWDLYQPRRMVAFAEGRWFRIDEAGVLAYYLLLPFALGGTWLLRRRRPELPVLLAPVALVCVQVAVSYGLPRFRQAADIVIVVLAAVAITRLADRRSRTRRETTVAA